MDVEDFRSCMTRLARFLEGCPDFKSLLIRVTGDTKLGRSAFLNPGMHILLQALSGVFNRACEPIDFGTLAESRIGPFKALELRIEQCLFSKGNALSTLLCTIASYAFRSGRLFFDGG